MFFNVDPFGMVALLAILVTSGFFFACVADIISWLMGCVTRWE